MSDQSKSSLDASEGSLGSAFNQDGSVGGMAQKIGTKFVLIDAARHLQFNADLERLSLKVALLTAKEL